MSAGWGARPVWWLERLGGWGEAAVTGAQGTNPSGLMTAPCCWWRPWLHPALTKATPPFPEALTPNIRREKGLWLQAAQGTELKGHGDEVL